MSSDENSVDAQHRNLPSDETVADARPESVSYDPSVANTQNRSASNDGALADAQRGSMPGAERSVEHAAGRAPISASACAVEMPRVAAKGSAGARTRIAASVTALGTRSLYWLPVIAPLVLFAQIAWLGLRPALCERARLAEAETALETRYRADVAEHDVIRANLRARRDPIFLERQRRWLQAAAPAR